MGTMETVYRQVVTPLKALNLITIECLSAEAQGDGWELLARDKEVQRQSPDSPPDSVYFQPDNDPKAISFPWRKRSMVNYCYCLLETQSPHFELSPDLFLCAKKTTTPVNLSDKDKYRLLLPGLRMDEP